MGWRRLGRQHGCDRGGGGLSNHCYRGGAGLHSAWPPSRRMRSWRDSRLAAPLREDGCSTHAPARGATGDGGQTPHFGAVSIHAPARGATAIDTFAECIDAEFQSTRPRGARRPGRRHRQGGRRVSIHAPARGATGPGRHRRCHRPGFNPRTRRGATSMPCWSFRPLAWFQSTRPHGARRCGHIADGLRALVSIHAPARGATAGRRYFVRSCWRRCKTDPLRRSKSDPPGRRWRPFGRRC